MKNYFLIFFLLGMIGCSTNSQQSKNINMNVSQNEIKNEALKNYTFLKYMYQDPYFPNFLVDKGKAVLIDLCLHIEAKNPKTLSELYQLTHAATNQFNYLENEFLSNRSEIETAAREIIAEDFGFIAKAYGFEADLEELIATRNW